jgi:hypothetical protein
MRILAIVLLLSVVDVSHSPKLPRGVTCAKVQEHYEHWRWVGRANIIRYLTNVLKYSAADVKAVERCLKTQ